MLSLFVVHRHHSLLNPVLEVLVAMKQFSNGDDACLEEGVGSNLDMSSMLDKPVH